MYRHWVLINFVLLAEILNRQFTVWSGGRKIFQKTVIHYFEFLNRFKIDFGFIV